MLFLSFPVSTFVSMLLQQASPFVTEPIRNVVSRFFYLPVATFLSRNRSLQPHLHSQDVLSQVSDAALVDVMKI